MSRVLRFLIFLCFAVGASNLSAQDIHFTQFNMSPLTLNPALSGNFLGTVRIGGIYRDQWSSILPTSERFTTPSFFVDAPLFRGIRRQDWIGAGLMLFQDQAGAGSLRHTAFKLGASYHMAFDKKQKNVLTLGIHYGGEQRAFNKDGFEFGDGFAAGSTSFDRALSTQWQGLEQDGNASYTDWDAGVTFVSQLSKTANMTLGASVFHMFEPNYGLLGSGAGGGVGGGNNGNTNIPRRFIFHGELNTDLNEKMTLSPRFAVQTMSGASEINLQTTAGYLFNEEKQVRLNFGLGYRVGDAVQVLLGAKKKDLTVGFAYDINTSPLSAVSNYRGGFELAANYIIRIYKPPVIKEKALCPRY